jgi:hypothetical protein
VSAIAVGIAGTPANIDPHVAAIGPAQFLQALQERREARLCLLIIRGQAHEHTDPPHSLALLRPRRARPRGRAAEHCHELPPPKVGHEPSCRPQGIQILRMAE